MLSTRGPRRSALDETSTKILGAARAIYALKGSRGTTTREIADRAGVNEATLFRHFGNKHALLDAMRAHYCEVSGFKAFVSTLSGNLEQDLYILALRMLEGIQRNADIIRISLAEEDLDPDAQKIAWRHPSEIHNTIIAYMAERVRSGELSGDPEMHGRLFAGMMFSRVMGRKLWKSQRSDQEFARYCVDVFLNGAKCKKARNGFTAAR
ncbi:MAG: TetR/AcrR family transcriptional regulator [Candidatus Eremiobacteraeota bacterium]|nr:TetR/AcrR family transcriptional regulator [Candidatus Eremiobacteraeota bacterium]